MQEEGRGLGWKSRLGPSGSQGNTLSSKTSSPGGCKGEVLATASATGGSPDLPQAPEYNQPSSSEDPIAVGPPSPTPSSCPSPS